MDRERFESTTAALAVARQAESTESAAPPSNSARSATATPDRLLRFPEVRARTGLSRSTIWRLERRGQFPRHHHISTNVVAWLESDIIHWMRATATAPLPSTR